MKWNMVSIVIAIGLLIILIALMTEKADKSDFDAAKEVIVMRKIAQDILRYTGDSTSRILPVNRLSATEFQIPFESSFSFKPDSLVRIIDNLIAENKLPSNYIVNVLESKSNKMIYGYAKLSTPQNSIVPCLGRNQPNMLYCIDIKFQESKISPVQSLYMGGIGLIAIGLLIFGVRGYTKKRDVAEPKEKEDENNTPDLQVSDMVSIEKETISIGKYLFLVDEQVLVFDGKRTLLTEKEAKILSIFASAPNQMIDRKRLQKEIWEDDGVIVGRSLDMFISRLRKKLEDDATIKIANIHSKGYKLEIIS